MLLPLGLMLLILLTVVNLIQAAASTRPGINFILADDFGYGDVGVFYQNQSAALRARSVPYFSTPSLDAPARASLLSGLTPGTESVVYKKVGDCELRLFIDRPADWKPTDHRAVIVFFHGGGWVSGGPDAFARQSEYFATRGMVGISAEYRLIPKGDSGPPTICCEDAKSAMRCVRSHATELGIDPDRIAAAGGSAGGHLAAFTALVPGIDNPGDDLKVSCKPEALVLFNPVFNNGPGQYGYKRVGQRFREFSPAHNISKDAPPTIVFLGDKDKLIPVSVLDDFQVQMKKFGVRCDAHVYPGCGHGFFNREPYTTLTLIEADKFLASLGWIKGLPTLKSPDNSRAQPAIPAQK